MTTFLCFFLLFVRIIHVLAFMNGTEGFINF